MSDVPVLAGASLSERVISFAADRIISGDWSPGSRLPSEPELAAQFGVSRAVVRDAVRVLATWGLLEVRHGVGTTVTHPSDDALANSLLLALLRSNATVNDLLKARMVVEAAVAEAAAAALMPDDCDRLRQDLQRMSDEAQAENWRAALQAHLAFHQSLLLATHLPALIIMLRPLQWVVLTSSLIPDSGDLRLYDIPEHQALLDAVVSGDAQDSRSAMEQHFRFTQDEAYTSLHSRRLSEVAELVKEVTEPGGGPLPTRRLSNLSGSWC